MKNFQSELRYLPCIVAFETVARYGNFTKAATELCITRAAVSRRIKTLESYLGTRLFNRLHRGVTLTSDGTTLFEIASSRLRDIAEIQTRLRSQSAKTHINVTMTMAFANFWLVPRLGNFREAFPDIDIRMVVSDQYLDLEQDDVDLAIRWCNQNRFNNQGELLFHGSCIPICSPSYIERMGVLESPDDLSDMSLIYLEGPYLPDTKWPQWFKHFEIEPPPEINCIFVDSYTSMVQAAMSGQGIALGDTPFLDHLKGTGSIIWPLSVEPVPTGSFRIIQSRLNQDNQAIDQFRNWLLSQAKSTPPDTV